MTWVVEVQWICNDGTIKRFRRECADRPSMQPFVNDVTGDVGVHLTEMDDGDRCVWARRFVNVDWYEFEGITDE